MNLTAPFTAKSARDASPGELLLKVVNFDGLVIRAAEDPQIPDIEYVEINASEQSAIVWAYRRGIRNMPALSVGVDWCLHIETESWELNKDGAFNQGMVGIGDTGLVMFAVSKVNSDPVFLSLGDFLISGQYPDCPFITRKWSIGLMQDGKVSSLIDFSCKANRKQDE